MTTAHSTLVVRQQLSQSVQQASVVTAEQVLHPSAEILCYEGYVTVIATVRNSHCCKFRGHVGIWTARCRVCGGIE